MSDGSTGDPRLRFRIWIGGRLTVEQWVDVFELTVPMLAQMQADHVAAVDRANAAGLAWMIEVYDPAEPDQVAYFRFGTDRDAMVQPEPVSDPDDLAKAILPMRLAEGADLLIDQQQGTHRKLDRAELAARIRDGLTAHGLTGPEYMGEVDTVAEQALPDDPA